MTVPLLDKDLDDINSKVDNLNILCFGIMYKD